MSDITEDELSPEELAEAQALAEEVDSLVAGKSAPAALGIAPRELVHSVAMIHAAHHAPSLADARKASLIEEAMAAATGADRATFATDTSDTSDLQQARAKRRRAASVGAMGLLVAAAALLLIWRAQPSPSTGEQRPLAIQLQLSENEQSRPSDALVGPISRADSGLAGERLQTLRNDRMAGYRSLQYRKMAGAL